MDIGLDRVVAFEENEFEYRSLFPETKLPEADDSTIPNIGIHVSQMRLQRMRESDPPVSCLVGTPKGRLTKLEDSLSEKPWHAARPMVKVRLLSHNQGFWPTPFRIIPLPPVAVHSTFRAPITVESAGW